MFARCPVFSTPASPPTSTERAHPFPHPARCLCRPLPAASPLPASSRPNTCPQAASASQPEFPLHIPPPCLSNRKLRVLLSPWTRTLLRCGRGPVSRLEMQPPPPTRARTCILSRSSHSEAQQSMRVSEFTCQSSSNASLFGAVGHEPLGRGGDTFVIPE